MYTRAYCAGLHTANVCVSFTSECPDWVFVKDDLYVTSFQYRQDRGKLAGEGVQCNPSWSLPVEPNLLATPPSLLTPLPPYPSLPSFPSNVYTYTLHIERFYWASLHAHTYRHKLTGQNISISVSVDVEWSLGHQLGPSIESGDLLQSLRKTQGPTSPSRELPLYEYNPS